MLFKWAFFYIGIRGKLGRKLRIIIIIAIRVCFVVVAFLLICQTARSSRVVPWRAGKTELLDIGVLTSALRHACLECFGSGRDGFHPKGLANLNATQ